MRRLLALILPVLATSLVSTPALADATLPGRGAVTDWSGLYVGASFAGMGGDARFDFRRDDLDGAVPGVFLGYRHDLGDVVVGAQLDYLRGRLSVENRVPVGDPRDGVFVTETQRFDLDRLVRLGVMVGADLGPVLVYGTAGVAQIAFSGVPTANSDGNGHFYGVGLDYALNDRLVMGAQVTRHRFGDMGVGYSADPVTFGVHLAIRF
jgi:opacity protein-like surface antigen